MKLPTIEADVQEQSCAARAALTAGSAATFHLQNDSNHRHGFQVLSSAILDTTICTETLSYGHARTENIRRKYLCGVHRSRKIELL